MSVGDISFYGDESGSHGQGTFVLSGYLGRDDDWSEFEDVWHNVLHDTSIGGHEIDYFHMRECYKLEDQFAPFTRWQADRKLNALVDVIRPFLRSKRLREFTSTIDWKMYNRIVTGPVRQAFHNPYLFTFGTVMVETARFIKDVSEQKEPIFFFMDDQTVKVEATVTQQFYLAKDTMPEEMATLFDGITFRSDKFCYPLQAADLIAWQRHRKELNLAEDLGERPELKKLHNALPVGSTYLFPYRESGLVKFAKRINDTLAAQ